MSNSRLNPNQQNNATSRASFIYLGIVLAVGEGAGWGFYLAAKFLAQYAETNWGVPQPVTYTASTVIPATLFGSTAYLVGKKVCPTGPKVDEEQGISLVKYGAI